jgi:hypothetical protein
MGVIMWRITRGRPAARVVLRSWTQADAASLAPLAAHHWRSGAERYLKKDARALDAEPLVRDHAA